MKDWGRKSEEKNETNKRKSEQHKNIKHVIKISMRETGQCDFNN